MTPERWEEIRKLIKKQFAVERETQEDLDDSPGHAEVLEFTGPLGFMRVEYITKAKFEGSKVHTSRRAGGLSYEEKLYSDAEVVQYLRIFKWDDDTEEWREIKEDIFS